MGNECCCLGDLFPLDGAGASRQAALMWEVVEVPVWAVWLVAVLAVIAVLDRVITPSLRWVFRRRVHRAIDRLNEQLRVRIQPFKLLRRPVLIDRLVHDPEVLAEMDAHIAETGKPREIAVAEVEGYAREIVPAFSAYAYFAVGARVSRWIAQALYRVRLGAFDEAALRDVDPNATIVFVMNHRSNVDYLLVTYLASTQSALSYAVGEWARVWPLSRIIRAMGAYFIRRRSRNALYRKVLARYVRMASDAGVTQAIFPEGGLSRDGRLAPPRLGLLSYIVDGFDPQVRDVVFVPVGLNYDRVLEDRLLLATDGAPGDAERFRVRAWTAVGYVARLAWLRVTGRLYRFGYACVSFGAPMSLAEFMRTEPADPVADLGAELTRRIGMVVPVLPVSLIAHVLLAAQAEGGGEEYGDADGGGPVSVIDLKVRAAEALTALHAAGAHSHIPRSDLDYAVEVGLRMLLLRGVVEEHADGLRWPATEVPVLQYYANAIERPGAPMSPKT